MSKRILSMLICLSMLFGLVPTGVFADGDGITETNGGTINAAGEIYTEAENSTEKAAAQSAEENEVSLFAAENIADVTIDGTKTSYSDIFEAFDAAQATAAQAEIKLTNDVDIGSSNIVLIKDGDITLDLNGFSLFGSFGEANVTTSNGMISVGASGENPTLTLTITDSNANKSGTIANNSGNDSTAVIRVCSTKATLNIEGGTFQRTGDDVTSDNAAVIDVAFGSAEISGGTINGNVYGITAESGAKSVTVKGDADVYGYYAAINSRTDANVNLSGGTFSSNGSTKPTFKTVGLLMTMFLTENN